MKKRSRVKRRAMDRIVPLGVLLLSGSLLVRVRNAARGDDETEGPRDAVEAGL